MDGPCFRDARTAPLISRNWADYNNGFGEWNGELWLGLDRIRRLTINKAPQLLRIDLKDFDGNNRYTKCTNFVVYKNTSYQQHSLTRLKYPRRSHSEHQENQTDSVNSMTKSASHYNTSVVPLLLMKQKGQRRELAWFFIAETSCSLGTRGLENYHLASNETNHLHKNFNSNSFL